MNRQSQEITPIIKDFVEEHERYVEIYKITCLASKKCYVGQAVSHILNHKKYRRYGMIKRFNGHVSEAYSTKKNQCHYLNNAIRKYGVDEFEVELLELCSVENSDKREAHYITELGTMFPNGYNLKLGTITTHLSDEGKKRVSRGVQLYYKDKKIERFKNVEIEKEPVTRYIHPLKRNGEQYGWYVLIKGKKADFGGVHIKIDESYKMAIEFIKLLKERQRNALMRETP